MERLVIDASAAVEYLLRTELGIRLVDVLEGTELLAPELLDVEVLSVLRRAVLSGKLTEERAGQAVEDLAEWPIDRIAHAELVREAWKVRHNVSAYDAFYVAAARLFDAPLLTADGPLSRSPGLAIVVHNIRIA